MKIAVIHDYADVFRTTRAYQRLQGQDVVVHTDAYTDPARVVEQVSGCEAVLLTQQRVPVTREIVARLPDLRFISQTSANVYHIDLAACTEHGVVVSAGLVPDDDLGPTVAVQVAHHEGGVRLDPERGRV